ncbi:Ca-activated chloride channel family protein [Cognatiyoonia koreensis]|uniref:Ca-activated chloride channel family protein n=1 Tax=Cognatiyoonia koreensis TaxID=364200 RepID=A0A1I0QY21_9RHOB|nr:VWA domain-containing protein [Cognatiyoonia koreensis]SEW32754.1 Ca-activated chloride channel family protein [Cognatiyoonia koreensis]
MRLMSLACTAFVIAFSTDVSAQRLTAECQALFDEITADVPVDIAQCTPVVPTYDLQDCVRPSGVDDALPASHLILAIDASGSMAGSIDGETKMEIAKREAVSFLADLDENISVGLVVYGHLGNNQQDGKAESCASSEMIHGFDADRADLATSIEGLSPTGWTPMGGVLTYSGELIAALPEPDGEDVLAPVIYLISDGEETCDSDPVTAATTLYEAGVRTTVNTIGFAVDAETQAQLEAVAAAGGGTFYPAETGSILREKLQEIAQSERDMITYEFCVQGNANRIDRAFVEVSTPAMHCYNRNAPRRLLQAVMAANNNAPDDDPLYAECSNQMVFEASDIAAESGNWVIDVLYPFLEVGRELQNEYLIEQGFPPRFPPDK